MICDYINLHHYIKERNNCILRWKYTETTGFGSWHPLDQLLVTILRLRTSLAVSKCLFSAWQGEYLIHLCVILVNLPTTLKTRLFSISPSFRKYTGA